VCVMAIWFQVMADLFFAVVLGRLIGGVCHMTFIAGAFALFLHVMLAAGLLLDSVHVVIAFVGRAFTDGMFVSTRLGMMFVRCILVGWPVMVVIRFAVSFVLMPMAVIFGVVLEGWRL